MTTSVSSISMLPPCSSHAACALAGSMVELLVGLAGGLALFKDGREVHLNRGSLVDLRVNPNMAANPFDDTVDRRQAKAGAGAFWLRAEERFEGSVHHF